MKQVAHTTCFIDLICLLTNFIKKGQGTNVGVGHSPWINSCRDHQSTPKVVKQALKYAYL